MSLITICLIHRNYLSFFNCFSNCCLYILMFYLPDQLDFFCLVMIIFNGFLIFLFDLFLFR